MDTTWDEEQASPHLGDLSDVTKGQWAKVTHVRLGYDEGDFEWVRFHGLDARGYHLKIEPARHGNTEVCPEDVWGFRVKD